MLLAGDVGGTKTLLGLFEPGPTRPRHVASASFPTQQFQSFGAILDAFSAGAGRGAAVDAAVIGVAGPVVHQRARLTNIDWDMTVDDVAERLATGRVALLNDLEAMAHAVEVLGPDEIEILQEGKPDPQGNSVLIAAGTGLGQAYLHRINGRLLPVASEGGHADFAARSDAEFGVVRMLRDRHGRAEIEQVLSGPGIVNLHHFTHDGIPCEAVGDLEPAALPAAITEAALEHRCARCEAALSMFVEAYGAETGNLALRAVATGGVFVGGGIAPKILPALRDGRFIAAFRSKPPMADLLARIRVQVILNPDSGLLGAAVAAQNLTVDGATEGRLGQRSDQARNRSV